MKKRQGSPFLIVMGEGPFAAASVHAGHDLRPEVAERQAVSEADRLREEDPFSSVWTRMAPTRLVARRSRFQVDLNRPRETAVYIQPEDAWGIRVWRQAPQEALVARSLEEYDEFYRRVERAVAELVERHGLVVVFDLHTYNHARAGPDGPRADPEGNPEVNVGTGTMDRQRWAPVVDRFIGDLRAFDFQGRRLDARENVKFLGRALTAFIHRSFPTSACALAVEVKKFFMDEWTGEVDREQFRAILAALRSTLPGLREELQRLGGRP